GLHPDQRVDDRPRAADAAVDLYRDHTGRQVATVRVPIRRVPAVRSVPGPRSTRQSRGPPRDARGVGAAAETPSRADGRSRRGTRGNRARAAVSVTSHFPALTFHSTTPCPGTVT